MDWILNRPYCFETKNYIFVHGFLPFDYETLRPLTDDLSEVEEEHWKSACFAQTPQMITKFAQYYPDGLDKTIVFGHWHNSQLRKQFDEAKTADKEALNSIWKNEKLRLCGLDCCTFVSHKIEMLVVED